MERADALSGVYFHALRVVSIARAFASGASALCIDEPTAGLSDREADAIRGAIRRVAELRSAIVVTHNQRDLAALGGRFVLLAGGIAQEDGFALSISAAPRTEALRQFVETGSCSLPSPDAVEEELSDDAVALLPRPRSGYLRWVLPGLAGIARPGIVRPLDEDLDTLAAEGVSLLIGLEEREMVPREALDRRGISFHHVPIRDMDAPTREDTRSLCLCIDTALAAGRRVAVHCKGGLGRTGTVLAAYLIHLGASAPEALSKVRLVEPRFVQAVVQLEHLRWLASSATASLGGAASDPKEG